MSRTKKYISLGCIAAVFSLGACSQVMQWSREEARKVREEQYQAERLEKGNAALAACIRTRCETLDLDGFRLDDFSVLNDLDHVTSIMVSRTNFDDLNDISGMSHLKELHISYSEVSDLEGLRHFPNLTLLHAEGLHSGAAIDVAPVRELEKLTELALWTLESVDEAAVVKDLPLLENLVLDWKGTDGSMGFLAGHRSLKHVEIGRSRAADYSALFSLPKLEAFSYYLNYSSDLNENTVRILKDRGVALNEIAIVMC